MDEKIGYEPDWKKLYEEEHKKNEALQHELDIAQALLVTKEKSSLETEGAFRIKEDRLQQDE